ncbi:MAG: indole-3-glycerol phosphate synthase TrpC [candidate division KSB1 bacterium]|nr:indole-3-glycerol phosphate synthase TrpC [candidate division KSB1 bacterium]
MTLLEPILEAVRSQTERRKKQLPLRQCRDMAEGVRDARPSFSAALKRRDVALIAEIKKASPSKGLLCSDFQPAEIARAYEQGGAAAVSVLTEEQFFQGSLEDLACVANQVSLPLLRKDFVLDPYQIYEAKLHGASAVLLLACLLDPMQLMDYVEICRSVGLEALIEVHNERELDTALAASRLIGVNNRDLKTFIVDRQTSFRLVPLIPAEYVKVSESGFSSFSEIQELRRAGYDAFLVGEALMRAQNRTEALRRLRGENADQDLRHHES